MIWCVEHWPTVWLYDICHKFVTSYIIITYDVDYFYVVYILFLQFCYYLGIFMWDIAKMKGHKNYCDVQMAVYV